MERTAPRYALYYAPPPASALWRFGSAVLGYDAETGEDIPFPEALAGGLHPWATLVARPRLYGFHATLKAPFHLKAGHDEAELLDKVASFARADEPVMIPRPVVAALGSFIALVPGEESAPLQEFAGRCVGAFEHLRAPLAAEDIARHKAGGLTARQTIHLQRYGYPHVFEDFRFHMTLTGLLPEKEIALVRGRLEELYLAEVGPLPSLALDQVAVFRQEARDARFVIIGRFPLGQP